MKVSSIVKLIRATTNKHDPACPFSHGYLLQITNGSGVKEVYVRIDDMDRRYGALRSTGKYQHSMKVGADYEYLTESRYEELKNELGW